jgi:predicted nucleic acid-binding protein
MSTAEGPPVATSACLVVDASIVMKWHVSEVHTDAALRLLRNEAPVLHVPDLMFPEVGNILWKKTRRGDLTEQQARGIGRLVIMAPVTVHPSAPLIEAALEIAMRTGRTVYDSLYVALAMQLNGRLVTADEKLYNALKDGPLSTRILWIEGNLGIPSSD